MTIHLVQFAINNMQILLIPIILVTVKTINASGSYEILTPNHQHVVLCVKVTGNENRHLGTGFFVHQRIAPAVKRVEFVSDRMSYIVLRGRWCNIIVLNVHAPSEEKSDNSKDSFYEELEQVFDYFPKYDMKILLGDFNAKVGRENIFKLTTGNESLHQDSNDNGVRIVNLAVSKNLVVKSTMFPHRDIHKHTWTSPDGKKHN